MSNEIAKQCPVCKLFDLACVVSYLLNIAV